MTHHHTWVCTLLEMVSGGLCIVVVIVLIGVGMRQIFGDPNEPDSWR